MMKQWTIFQAKEDSKPFIVDVFRMLVGSNIEIFEQKEYMEILHTPFSFSQIEAAFQSLEEDLNTTICLYQTYPFEKNSMEKELILPYFLKQSYGKFQLKSLLSAIPFVLNPTPFLTFILEGSGVDATVVKAMGQADLNVSKAAGKLYMHRNTLLYKLDRLKQLKDFDLRSFTDCMLLYRLL